MKADTKYWKHLAAFAYRSYLDFGDGVVLIKEQPSKPFSPADLEKQFQYIPFDPDKDDIPMDAATMIVDYDPKKEVILMITDAKGDTLCLQLTAEKLGITPLEAYKELHGKFVPGRLYKLGKVIGDVHPGYYVYEREEKAMLVFCLMGLDDDGDTCRTDELIKVHRDYRDYFMPTEMRIET